jgi:hybrid polyketide synthase/nonribosomal peptide synthetase ACE1
MGFPLIELFQKLDKPGLRLLNMYGPAEVMVPTMCEIAYRNTTAADMPLPVGPVRPNYIAYVVDNQDHPVPAGVPGELIVGGAGVGLGYINDLVLTAKKFQHDRFATPRAISRGWTRAHRTGDRVYLRERDGVFVLLGRITGDLQVKIRGQRLDVREVESSIIGTSGGDVVDAVVNLHQGEDGKIGSDSLVARVVLSPAATIKLREGDVRDGFLAKLVGRLPLPSYMLPSVVVSVPSLPLNKHGKVDRLSIAKLPLPSRSLRGTEVSTSIQTTDQQRMKEIWDYVLGDAMSQSTGPASDFFLVGGNSLLVITLQAELKERYRLDIPLTELFQRSTLGQMAELLQGKVAAPMQVDWETETKVDDNVRSMQHIRVKPPACENVVVVLTGATGFLGRHLLRGLISSTRVKAIHCVAVREPSKLRDMASPKVVIYSGDLRSPLLGLTEGDARTIFTSTDVIVHNGADVSFLKSYTTMRGANVASTKELVRLALLHRSAERLHFVSTAGVAALNMEELYEVPLPGYPPADSSNGYVVSKWACENYLENAFAATGLPVTIHRPTAIMGPGAPRLDVMHNVLHFAEKLRTVPEMQALEGWFQFVDIVDIAGDMVGDILGTEAGVGGVLYRNHSGTEAETVQISRLREYLTKKHSVEFTMVDDFEWVEKASTVGLAREIGEYLRSIGDAFKHGSKWVFPRVWKGTKNDRLRVT